MALFGLSFGLTTNEDDKEMGAKFLVRYVPMLAKKSLKRSGLRSRSEVLVD